MNIRQVRGESPTRLVPFGDNATSSAKLESDRCNTKGHLRSRACLGCIKNIGRLDSSKEPGRGSTRHLEVFSCLVDKAHGDGGRNCARCIGISRACEEIPEQFEADAAAFVKLLPDFNAAAQVAVDERTDDQLATLVSTIAKGKVLTRGLENFVKAQKRQEVNGPSGSSHRAGSPRLEGNQPATRSDIARLERLVDDLGGIVERASQDAFDANRLARQCRDTVRNLRRAWKRSSSKEGSPLVALGKMEDEESGVSDSERPRKRSKII